ncbi:MAG: hypothetical protein AAFQ68_15680 [Bacteroidota bacterium]
MKRYFWACLCLISSFELNGQTTTTQAWEFYQAILEQSQQANTSSCETIPLAILDKRIFKADSTDSCLPSGQQWQFLFEYAYSWEEVLGREPLRTSQRSHKAYSPVPYQCENESAVSYTSEELIESFGLCSISSELAILHIEGPEGMLARNHPRNRIWVATVSGEHLILQYIHRYPNGNMTSFYRESRLYFQRIP